MLSKEPCIPSKEPCSITRALYATIRALNANVLISCVHDSFSRKWGNSPSSHQKKMVKMWHDSFICHVYDIIRALYVFAHKFTYVYVYINVHICS